MEAPLVYSGHSLEADRLTLFFLASFRFHGTLVAAAERLTAPIGLTAAKWQVLSTIARAKQPETVANVGRIIGLTRQGVQRTVNELCAAGLLRTAPNPHHKRAFLICLTDLGHQAFMSITARQVPWANALAAELDVTRIDEARCLMATLTQLLDGRAGEG